MVASPISLLDSATIADGAAAMILTAGDISQRKHVTTGSGWQARQLRPQRWRWRRVLIRCGSMPLQRRPPVTRSRQRADVRTIDVADISDQHGIVAALSLEAVASRGVARHHAGPTDGHIALTGEIPLATGGGCKARGDSCRCTRRLSEWSSWSRRCGGTAGANQVAGARRALARCYRWPRRDRSGTNSGEGIMELAKHWRLKPQRYRLEGTRNRQTGAVDFPPAAVPNPDDERLRCRAKARYGRSPRSSRARIDFGGPT